MSEEELTPEELMAQIRQSLIIMTSNLKTFADEIEKAMKALAKLATEYETLKDHADFLETQGDDLP